MEQPQLTPPASLATFRPAWPLFACMMVCAAICQYRMIGAYLEDLRYVGNPLQFENLKADYLLCTIYMCLEVAACIVILRPWTYDLLLSQGRTVALTIFTLVAAFFQLGYNSIYPNEISKTQLVWNCAVLGGALTLIFMGVVASLIRQMRARKSE